MNLEKLYGPAKVGGDTLSYCGACKMELAHVIVSMVDQRPAQVSCKTCGAKHKFKGAPGAKTTVKKTPGRPSTRKVKVSDYWEEQLAKNLSPAKPYRPTESFAKNDVVEHSKFGLGIVEEVKLGNKIVVLFSDEMRTLLHEMK